MADSNFSDESEIEGGGEGDGAAERESKIDKLGEWQRQILPYPL